MVLCFCLLFDLALIIVVIGVDGFWDLLFW